MIPIELIIECHRAIAAISSMRLSLPQLRVLYSILPPGAQRQPDLADRWAAADVLCDPDYLSAQLHRTPMLRPKGTKICFL